MSVPCNQEGSIAVLQAGNLSLMKAVERMEEAQKEFITLLKNIAQQQEQIKTLFQRIDHLDTDVDVLYGRVRVLELNPGQLASQLQLYGLSAIIAAAVGFIVKKYGG
jgi:septal ring factor EnvC (AmiA/AmiB activator)